MKQKFGSALSLALIVAMLFTSVALADNVVNDIDAIGDYTFTAPGSTTIGYKINATGGDGGPNVGGPGGQCNASDGTPVIVALSVPAGVTASTTSLSFATCNAFQYVIFSSSTAGNYSINVSSISDSGAGSYSNQANFTLYVSAPADSTAPVITPSVSGTLGNNGWYTSDVIVTWSVSDPDSTVTSMSGCGPTTINTDTAGITLTCTATSAGGTSSQSVTIKRDATAPSISAALDKSPDAVTGWFNVATGAPTANFTCSDATSGLAGDCPASHLFGEGADQAYSQNISDNAGNSASAGVTNVDVDLTAPSITITAPANNASYILNQVVAANYGCTDGTSGVAACAGPVANGGNIDTSIGSKSFKVDATDGAGNSSSLTNNYTVSYKVCALYDQTKSHKSGSTVPVKLQLCDVNGVNYSAANIVVNATSVRKIDNTAGTLDDSGYANSPDMNFRYDAALGGYIFNLSLKGYTTGTWKLFFTVDGQGTYSVQFDVK